MKKLLRILSRAFDIACARLYVAAQVFIAAEPVRARAWLTSALIAVGTIVPALAMSSATAGVVAGVILSALTVAMGESARKKVTPTNE